MTLQSDPSDVPGPLRPYLQMRDPHRVPRALSAADRAGDDEQLRTRVALVVGEEELSRAEVLWLERPEGWEDELEGLVSARRTAREEADAVRLLDRERRARARAEADRDRAHGRADEAEAERDALRAEAATAIAAHAEAAAGAVRAREERAAAVAALKELEAAHVRAHDELRDLRAHLDAARTPTGPDPLSEASGEADPGAGSAPTEAMAPPGSPSAAGSEGTAPDVVAARALPQGPGPQDRPALDHLALARAVGASASAAAALAASLAEVAAQIGPGGVAPDAPPERGGPQGEGRQGGGPQDGRPDPGAARGTAPAARERKTARPPRRQPAPLPGGIHDDAPLAAEHLVRLPGVALLVDGYNASMATWPDLDIESQRRRLIAALNRLEARCGAEVIVVFDGVDDGGHLAPGPTRRVRVEFTAATVEADDVIIERVCRLPATRPVVVVSDDRRVREGSRAGGANLVTTTQLRALFGPGAS